MLVFKITQMPDSVFIKISSKNADILENNEFKENIKLAENSEEELLELQRKFQERNKKKRTNEN